MFTGLSAFPLTPFADDRLDEPRYAALVRRLAAAGVDSITALGSTGSYAYLSREERRTAARIAVDNAGDIPVFVGIGALRTSHAQAHAADAQGVGAAGVLLAPLSYQALDTDEVFGLFEDVTRGLSVPLVVYDNPATTHFVFTDELYGRVAQLPQVASIKIPAVPSDSVAARARIDEIRRHLPAHVTVGISGDWQAADGLNAGCEAWYSVIGGTFPELAVRIARAALSDDAATATAESERLEPLWTLFRRHGSLRVRRWRNTPVLSNRLPFRCPFVASVPKPAPKRWRSRSCSVCERHGSPSAAKEMKRPGTGR